MDSGLLAFTLVALEAVAVLFAFRAIRTARTPQGSVGWAVFLIAAPYVAVPAFLFLGHSRFPAYSTARRASKRAIEGLHALRAAYGVNLDPNERPDLRHGVALERLAEMPIVSGNSYELLVDGAATFGAIFAAIGAAERYVLLSSFIMRHDDLGNALKDKLIARARAGVTVKVIYDEIGSKSLSKTYLAELRAAGVDIRSFHATRRPANRFQINFRNHRKIVVCDGKVGFVGGLNFGDEYMGRDPAFGRWRDTHVRLRGPVLAQLQLVFSEDWHWASDEVLALDWTVAPVEKGSEALIMATGPGDPYETGSLYFCSLISAARERLWIASPYFVPDLDVATALKIAALRGVDVRILVPDKIDHLIVWLAGYAYYDEMREAGVRFFRYQDGFMHQKVLVVDREIAAVGTHNLDIRSCRLNFEITALLFGGRATAEVAEMLEADFAASQLDQVPLSRHGPLRRFGAPIARLFAPVL